MEQYFLKIQKMNLQKYLDFLQKEDLEHLHSFKLYLDDIYYNTGDSSLEDVRYDMLKDILKKRDKSYKPPVGVKLREGENRANLPFWLGSADKITAEKPELLSRWKKKHLFPNYVISEKLDGVSLLLFVKDGKLNLYTRGDGSVGADISYLSKYLNLPKIKENIAVRGELIIQKETFLEKYKETYKNPRNMVSGLISGKTARKGLEDIHFVTYEMVGDSTMPKLEKQLKTLATLGFEVVKYKVVDYLDLELLSETLTQFKKTSKYELDGLIVQSNEPYDRNISGNPDYMFAFKMTTEDSICQTTVKGVEWNITKWGQLKPVVLIEPVDLSGVTINRVTAHNAKYVEENNIGPDSVIRVTRSNEVIPYIVEVVKGSMPQMPDVEYKWDDTHVNIVAVKYDNMICVKLISSFFSHMGIKHVSEATVKKMYDDGLDNLLKIISASKERLLKVPEFGEKSADRIYTNIRNGLKNLKIASVLGASGVLGFGIGSKRMDALFLDIPDLLIVYKSKSQKEISDIITKVEGFSHITADKISKNLKYADLLIKKLSPYVSFKKETRVSEGLKGQKFAISGFRDKKLEEDITQRGGKLVGTVSKNTTALIVQSKEGKETGKCEKALELGVPIYEKEEFREQYIV